MNSTEFTKNSLAEASGNPKPQSVDRVIKDNIMADQISKDSEGNYIFRKGYYYRPAKMDPAGWADIISKNLQSLGIDHTVVDSGDIWKPFRGGASLKAQSHYFVKVRLNSADSVGEGYRVVPSIDRERYQERSGLEGPFRAENGKVVYYDPVEGKYIDPDTDIYISHSDWQAMNQRDIQEGYWQDAVKKAEADREARQGKPFDRNPASHDKHGVYVGDKDLAGDPVPKRKQSDVSEAGYDFNKPYGVKYKVFGSRDGRIVTKEFWASTPEKLEKAVAKIEALDNFYEIDGYHDPRPDQQSDVAEDMDPNEENDFHVELDKLVHKYFGHSSAEKMKNEQGVSEAFADQGSGHTGTSREDKRIAALLKAKNMPAKTKPIKKVAAEAKTLKKRVRVVKGEHADKTGWIREIKHGAFKGAPKSFNVDLDDGGQADNLPASSLRLVKDQQGVAEDIDRENPIVKEYYALMKNDIKTLRNLLKQQTKIIDTSEYTTKDHAISAYLHNKHGSGRVNAAFGLDEQGVSEADKRPAHVVSIKDKPRKVKPTKTGQSAHPYQGKMVGEQQKHSSAYSKGFSDGVYGQRDPRASSYGPGVDDYDAGFAAGLEHEKQQKQQRATKYKSDIAPYMSMTVAELEAEQQQIKKQMDVISDMARRGKLSAEQNQKYRELGDQFQIIHQAKFQKQQNPDIDEGAGAKFLSAAALVAAMMAGNEVTSAKHTELGKAMKAAAEAGDDEARYHLRKLDTYIDTKQSKLMQDLVTKYLPDLQESSKKKTPVITR